MSQQQVDNLTNAAGTGPVAFPFGYTIGSTGIGSYFTGTVTGTGTNSGGYADVGGSTSVAQHNAKNLIVTNTNGILGVTWTPSSLTAAYLVCANTQGWNNTTNDQILFKLTDGSVDLCFSQITVVTGSGSAFACTTLSGLYVPASVSPVTLRVQYAASGGTAKIQDAGFTIYQISS